MEFTTEEKERVVAMRGQRHTWRAVAKSLKISKTTLATRLKEDPDTKIRAEAAFGESHRPSPTGDLSRDQLISILSCLASDADCRPPERVAASRLLAELNQWSDPSRAVAPATLTMRVVDAKGFSTPSQKVGVINANESGVLKCNSTLKPILAATGTVVEPVGPPATSSESCSPQVVSQDSPATSGVTISLVPMKSKNDPIKEDEKWNR